MLQNKDTTDSVALWWQRAAGRPPLTVGSLKVVVGGLGVVVPKPGSCENSYRFNFHVEKYADPETEDKRTIPVRIALVRPGSRQGRVCMQKHMEWDEDYGNL